MKKVLACLLVVFMALTLFACDNIADGQQDATDGVQGAEIITKNKTKNPSDQIGDLDNDNCPYTWSVYDEGHSLIMLCGCCEAPAVLEPHEDKDIDNYCDDCGYEMSIYPEDLAQIVIDYEKSLQDDADNLSARNPGCHYYYQVVDKIICSLNLGEGASPEDLVEKYDMYNVFNKADISTYSYIKSSVIRVKVDRDNLTEAMYQKLKKISEEEPLVESLYVYLDETYVITCIPEIEYYTDNAVKIDFEKTDSIYNLYYDRGFIIKSKDEYDDFIDSLLEAAKYEYQIELINEHKDSYDELFFEDNALIITNIITLSSGSIKSTVDNVYVSENKLYLVVKTDTPQICTDDVQEFNYTLAVPKDEVPNVTEVIILE